MVHFDIVHGCQLRCIGCPNSTILDKVSRIPVDRFARCLDNLDAERIQRFQLFNFGEPLLHDDLPQLFEVLRGHRSRIGEIEISTNAQFVRWPQLEAVIASRLLDRLVVSCDGDGTAESFERLRPPARWPVLMEFIERVAELKHRLHPGLELMTRTIVDSRAAITTWRSILQPMGWRPTFRGWKIMPDAAENPSGRSFVAGRGACTFVEPADSVFIDADGTVVPCCAHPRAGDFGNLQFQKYSKILASQARAEFVADMIERREQMSICARCEYGPRGNVGPSGSKNSLPKERISTLFTL